MYDTLDRHLAEAGDLAHATVPMGMLLAWCVNMHLVSTDVTREHERLILRIRFGEAKGSELLVAAGGDLTRDLFNDDGCEFLDRYYDTYMTDFDEEFDESTYQVADNYQNYERVAAFLTKAFMTGRRHRNQPLFSSLSFSSLFRGLRRWLN